MGVDDGEEVEAARSPGGGGVAHGYDADVQGRLGVGVARREMRTSDVDEVAAPTTAGGRVAPAGVPGGGGVEHPRSRSGRSERERGDRGEWVGVRVRLGFGWR